MSILSVVRDVCAAVGVNPPTSMFGSSVQPRTQIELLSLANEVAQRIAYDVREWRALKAIQTYVSTDGVVGSDGVARYALPANFKRLLLSSQVYPSWAPRQPLIFVPDANDWLVRRLNSEQYSWGEWTLIGTDMLVHPAIPADPPGQGITFAYLNKNCVRLAAGGFSDQFMADGDEFLIDERLLRLGMIWQWKANKGSPYAEDMGTYSDALVIVGGADSPAPIIVSTGRGWVDAAHLQ